MTFLLLWFPLTVDVKRATPAIHQFGTNLLTSNTAFGIVLHRLKIEWKKDISGYIFSMSLAYFVQHCAVFF